MLTDLKSVVLKALEDIKALDINTLDVADITSITDHMIIATGTSTRHVKAIADAVVKQAKATSVKPIGVEGQQDAEWILIDLGDLVVHVMRHPTREFYNIDKLWQPIHASTAAVIA